MRGVCRPLGIAILGLTLLAGTAVAGHDRNDDEDGGWWHHTPSSPSAPEIDPGMLGGVAALIGGGFLILRDRRRR